MKKFRVWHKEFNRFLTGEEWMLDFNGNLKFINIIDIETTVIVDVPKNLYVVHQFTGLMDINNKEICEGDIIECVGESIVSWDRYILEVTFDRGAFMLEECPIGNNSKSELEVIGNILENPELLD